jgi:hypothetical protein
VDAQLSSEAVANLVTQFSSALDFYRELVQNSIDAGSSNIDVWLEFEPGDRDEGVISIHVDDFGEGMSEAIIDDQLTRLFSSTKEDDLTKIGKFGIGFVSVFAMHPKGVLVHTGRDGEYWEVFFHEDRSFTKARIDTPVEGTQITLFLTGDVSSYRDLVERSQATLERWCSHSDTEITFEDRSPLPGSGGGPTLVNRPFEVPGDCMVRVEHPETELCVAFSTDPIYGFYNKGLALAVAEVPDDLLSTRADRYRHIACKLKSRYLEHTLSRETVMQDANYEKAMALLDEAVAGPLRSALVAELQQLAAVPEWNMQAAAHHARLLGYLAREPASCLLELDSIPLMRTVGGAAASLRDARDAVGRDGRVFVAASSSRLTAFIQDQGTPVFFGGQTISPTTTVLIRYLAEHARTSIVGFLRKKFTSANLHEEATKRIAHPENVLVSVEPSVTTPGEVASLLTAARTLLDRVGAGYGALRYGTIASRPDRPVLFALGRKIGPLMALPPEGRYRRGRFERPHALVNLEHPHFQALLETARHAPELAAYALAKSLMLEEDRLLERDLELCRHSTEQLRVIA